MAYDEGLADRVREVFQDESALTEKKMFGGLAFLVNGNMAVGASSKGGLCCASTRQRPTRSSASPRSVGSR